jgi:hypothetical protein
LPSYASSPPVLKRWHDRYESCRRVALKTVCTEAEPQS